ncbi:hypothetical protein L4C33_06400 [Vibrio makurazakiensis]|uniref:hypothetical protein n=1 Tax=Vibrio makurazakiensis TaxID=2910250 RepID=UPI003D0E575E
MSPNCLSEIYVVMSPDSQVEHISKKDLTALYLGRKRATDTGEEIHAIDRAGELRSEFFNYISNMSINQIDAYWAKLHFSGRVPPLQSLEGYDELTKYLLNNPSFVGYVRDKPIGDELKVVMVIHD